jgi:hypothetical protein
MYRRPEALRDFRAPFRASFDHNAAPDGKGYGVLTDADSHLVSMFRTRKEALAEARSLNLLARSRPLRDHDRCATCDDWRSAHDTSDGSVGCGHPFAEQQS